ncbi:MAG: hypothetical protein Pg6A_08570 [Termitinemataceae bacterium]|nr:MAG: hypothetical protein Pg6A_08570 [Termitinemataceae bacterium]
MKTAGLVFSLVFVAIVSVPFIFIDNKNSISLKENRTLAQFPHFMEDGKINSGNIKKVPAMLDAYINDRFGFRDAAVSFAKKLSVTGRKKNGDVLIGKEGWLFYVNYSDGNNLSDFYKMNLFTPEEINQFIINIENRLDFCNDNGIQFLFLIAPNKHNIYSEYYPFERPQGITRTEQIMAALPDKLKNVVIYPRDWLIKNKRNDMPLYFETDTHWNMAGAHYAFELLYDNIKNRFLNTQFPEMRFTVEVRYDSSGDIVPMSGFTSYEKRTIPDLRPQGGWDSFYRYIKNEGRDGDITENKSKTLPKAIVYRDSFFSALEPFTSCIFSYTEYHWRFFSETEKQYILERKPDIVICEIVERSLKAVIEAQFKPEIH